MILILLKSFINESKLSNCETVSDEKTKSQFLKNSIFAVAKSGTISLEICNSKVPSIIIYKMNFINYFIAKLFLKIKFVNMLNIIKNKEIIPELIQRDCNSNEIFKSVYYFLKNPKLIERQLLDVGTTINDLKSSSSSSEEASKILLNYLA